EQYKRALDIENLRKANERKTRDREEALRVAQEATRQAREAQERAQRETQALPAPRPIEIAPQTASQPSIAPRPITPPIVRAPTMQHIPSIDELEARQRNLVNDVRR